jgi:hypothetical protein
MVFSRYDIVFKRCLELIGDTVDINHVITATSMQCEYNVIELLANKAKENGTHLYFSENHS